MIGLDCIIDWKLLGVLFTFFFIEPNKSLQT